MRVELALVIMMLSPFLILGSPPEALAQGDEKDYLSGYYLPMRESRNLFPELGQIEISTTADRLPTVASCMILYPVDADTSLTCTMLQISLSGDELTFTTNECSNYTYKFQGRFLRWGMMDFLNDEVLRGEMSIFRGGVLVKKGTVGFIYSEGC